MEPERVCLPSLAVCVAGGRHAMGGQQFASGAVLLDTQSYRAVRHFDSERGLVEVESGIQWPELITWLVEHQVGAERQWGIHQKQTGADRLSIGGAVAANVHGSQARGWVEEWSEALDGPTGQLVDLLVRQDEHGIDMRQVSPFAGVLSDEERGSAIRKARRW